MNKRLLVMKLLVMVKQQVMRAVVMFILGISVVLMPMLMIKQVSVMEVKTMRALLPPYLQYPKPKFLFLKQCGCLEKETETSTFPTTPIRL
jgi:hypothetical protein